MTDQNTQTKTGIQGNQQKTGADLMSQAIQKQAQNELINSSASVSLPKIKTTTSKQSTMTQNIPNYLHTTQLSSIVSPKNAAKLSNAYMRTFKKDATIQSGTSAAEIDTLLPKQSPLTKTSAPHSVTKMSATQKQEGTQPRESVVHTYRDDVQSMVKNKQLSLMRMAAMESNQTPVSLTTNRKTSPSVSKGLVVMLLFIIVGVIAMTGAYMTYISREAVQRVAPYQARSLIFTEGTEYVNINKKTPRVLKRLLTKIRTNSFYSLGSIINIAITTEEISSETNQVLTSGVPASQFLLALSDELPESFARLFKDEFMLGLHVTDENKPFLILKTNSYDDVFSGMLTWESRLEQDLHPLFSPTDKQTGSIFSGNNTFKDVVMKNLVTRVLRDENNNIRILYAFINAKTLIITTNIDTLLEVKTRLRIAK